MNAVPLHDLCLYFLLGPFAVNNKRACNVAHWYAAGNIKKINLRL
jgi:hypothetical protein